MTLSLELINVDLDVVPLTHQAELMGVISVYLLFLHAGCKICDLPLQLANFQLRWLPPLFGNSNKDGWSSCNHIRTENDQKFANETTWHRQAAGVKWVLQWVSKLRRKINYREFSPSSSHKLWDIRATRMCTISALNRRIESSCLRCLITSTSFLWNLEIAGNWKWDNGRRSS